MRNRKSYNNAIMTCHSCNMRVMLRGDWSGWKGVQEKPGAPETFRWFCSKEVCQKAYRDTLQAAIAEWADANTESTDE